MHPEAFPDIALPHRCGNCGHAERSGIDSGIVACTVRLEFQCADRIADCASYRPVSGADGLAAVGG